MILFFFVKTHDKSDKFKNQEFFMHYFNISLLKNMIFFLKKKVNYNLLAGN